VAKIGVIMTMNESVPLNSKVHLWSRADADVYLTSVAIGVIAGIAVAYVRTPLHMPGHKVLLWMTPIVATRLLTRVRAGASASVLATIVTTLLLGGNLAGGAAMMPLVLAAGITLDVAVGWVERRRMTLWSAVSLLALAGIAGNLICFIKRLFDPMGSLFSAATIQDLLAAGASHAFFGGLAGIIGGLCGLALLKYRRGSQKALSH
jgi:hypothetical protein